jgi:hypothetical protein
MSKSDKPRADKGIPVAERTGQGIDGGKNAAGSTYRNPTMTPAVPEFRLRRKARGPYKTLRKTPESQEPIELDPAFVNNPGRLQYAFLLALLFRCGGTAKFSKLDMDLNDTDYNILFARTLDGKMLEVTVVSSESGIIRSSEAPLWQAGQTPTPEQYVPLPAGYPAQELLDLHNRPAPSPAPAQAEAQQGATVLPMPAPPPAEATPKPYVFPFQSGNSPADAGPVDLDALTAQVMGKDRRIAQEEREAASRVERGE